MTKYKTPTWAIRVIWLGQNLPPAIQAAVGECGEHASITVYPPEKFADDPLECQRWAFAARDALKSNPAGIQVAVVTVNAAGKETPHRTVRQGG
jgi:hypothetical protein